MNPDWRCSSCNRPSPDRIRTCVCVSSRCFNSETGLSAPKVSVSWRIEIAEARNQLAQQGAST